MVEAKAEVLAKVFEHAEAVDKYCAERGYIRLFTGLFGSQNYNLDTEHSDVDTKSIVIPSMRDWLWGDFAPATKVIEMPDGSHAEVKPLVEMAKQFERGNINFLEVLFTPYVDIAPDWIWFYEKLYDNRDNIARHNLYKQASVWFGYVNQMLTRTLRASRDSTFPNPEQPYIDSQGYNYALGYNPKAFANALRLKETCIRYFNFNRPFEEAIDMSGLREDLIPVKKGSLPKHVMLELHDDVGAWLKKEHDYVQEHYVDVEKFDAHKFLMDLTLEVAQACM